MKRLYTYLVGAAVMGLCACGSHDHDDGLGHHHDHEHGEAHEAGSEINLSEDAAERFGVESDIIYPGTFSEVIKVTGQIVDNPASASVVTAPTSGILRYTAGIQQGKAVGVGSAVATISAADISGGDPNKTAKVAIDAAKRELDRLTPLYEEGIVSAKDYNAAREAYEMALSQYSKAAASGTAKAVTAGVITDLLVANGQYVEAGTPIATVSANKRLTLRADVPDRYHNQIPLIQTARIKLPYSDTPIDLSALGGQKVSAAAQNTRIEPGYMPIYFSFDNDGRAPSRTLVEVYLIGAPRQGVISVPLTAVAEQQGMHFVFRQIDEDCYEKLPVKLGSSDGERVEILSGITPGQCIVTKGATAVRLAESSGAVPEGHSHSH